MSLSELSNNFSKYRESLFLSGKNKKKTKILPLEVDLINLFSGSMSKQNVNCLLKCEYCTDGCELCEYKGEKFDNFDTQIIIDKGTKDGDLIPFLDNNIQPYRYVFKITEVNKTPFQRKGHNLYYTYNISLKEAIGNCIVMFPFIDNTTISYPSNELITPKSIKIIGGKGMPVRYRSGIYGDLIISYNVIFPKSLSEDTRLSIYNSFPSDLFIDQEDDNDTLVKMLPTSDTELDIAVERGHSTSTTNNEQCIIS
jgi:hypothetical protein